MTSQFYTYLHCKPNGDPFYVGKGTLARSNNLAKRNIHHKRIVAKFGIEIFSFPRDTEQSAFDDEIKWIKVLREEGFKLANYTDGGDGSTGHTVSEAGKAKLSAFHKGKKISPEHRARINAALKGVKLSTERRAKISLRMMGNKRHKGMKHSAETLKKMSDTQKNRWKNLKLNAIASNTSNQ